RELVGRLAAVEVGDGVADVGLIAQQPVRVELRVRKTARHADDVEPGPRNVVLPEFTHIVLKGALRVCPSAIRSGEPDSEYDKNELGRAIHRNLPMTGEGGNSIVPQSIYA